MKCDLTGKTALICGASQGIGRATAKLMAQAGAQVVALARSREPLVDLLSELPGSGHSLIDVDLRDRLAVAEKLSQEISNRGSIDILVCNSGGPKGGPITEATDEDFMAAFENHVLANSLLVKMIFPGMKVQRWGRIINIISTSVKTPLPNLGVSNTIRAAVASWAKTLSMEVAPFGVTVNNVLPGYTETGRLAALIDAAAQRTGKSREAVEQEWLKSVPAGRFARPEEVASAILFLASENAAYINGINVPVDGGRTGAL